VANLTGFTRKTAHDIYGFRFGSGMANSSDFEVTASIKLREVNPVKPKDGSFAIFDKKEKQGELTVTSRVNYRGRHAKITLLFLLRVVKTFIPPYNYFTLFIRDGSAFGGSDWNSFDSLTGKQDVYLTLDHGWNDIITNFDATKHVADWEKALTQGQVPPGRVYMGQEPQLGAPATTIQATNGAKMLVDRPTLDQSKALQYNGQDNFWLKFDVPWMLFDDYRKKVTEIQGDQAIKKDFFDGIKGLFTDVFGKDVEIRVINVGAGQELTQDVAFGEPAFVRAVQSYIKFRDHRLRAPGQIPFDVKQVMYPEITKSGLHIFGHAPPPSGNINPYGTADFSKLSPTIVYGQVMRQYNRIVSLRRKPGASNPPFVDPKDPSTPINLEIPFIGTEPSPDGSAPPITVTFNPKSP
ncbi:MAG TPA: hypothetical protein PKO06_23735, partial [Candidatus Ozemobacteraceae bacterium]|nr:hypothetical protein [Candidatus Ozemobacteraceae bacterium]